MSYDIWIDYNDLGMIGANGATSLMKYATAPEKIKIGSRILTGDSEGNTCEGLVTDIERRTGLVTLFLYTETFEAAD